MIKFICGELLGNPCAVHIMNRIPIEAPTKMALSEYHLYFSWLHKNHNEEIFIDRETQFQRSDATNKKTFKSEECAYLEGFNYLKTQAHMFVFEFNFPG